MDELRHFVAFPSDDTDTTIFCACKALSPATWRQIFPQQCRIRSRMDPVAQKFFHVIVKYEHVLHEEAFA